MYAALLGHACLQPFVYRSTEHSISHPPVEKAPDVPVLDGVEVALDVHFDHHATAHVHQPPPQRFERLVGRPIRSKAVRAVQEILLVDCLQHHGDHPLQDFVLKGGYADGPERLAIRLGDVHPSYWRRPIRSRFEPVQQRLQVFLQIRRILGRRLAVNSGRAILPGPPVGLLQQLDVDVMGQRRERQLRCLSRQFCYPL